MVRIMIEPQHSIYRQFRAIPQNEGSNWSSSRRCSQAIADPRA